MSLQEWLAAMDAKRVPRPVAEAAYWRCQQAKKLPPAKRPAAMRDIVRDVERTRKGAAS